ncbi:MAG: amino acid ABC transporter substrate-binding protein [Rhodoferax sp.]|nr:amino acid ABC transporter substrate-binding protein [Rhodoferax sp.]
MKRWIVVLACALASLPARAESGTISVGWDDYPPYQIGPEAERRGIDLDVVQAALKAAGYDVRFVKLPWARQLKMLEAGALEMAMSASVSPERAKYAAWSNPYRTERAALMALQSNAAQVRSLKQLLGGKQRIGLIRDTSYPGEYDTLLANPEFRKLLEFTNVNLQNLEKLRAGRIDYVIDDPVTIEYLAHTSPGAKVRVVLEIMNEGSHFMVSKKFLARNSTFLERLNSALAAMKKSGATQKIFKAYGVSG